MTAKRSDDSQRAWWLLLAAAAGALLYLLGQILAPLLFAAILAYVCNPWVSRLERARVPRAAAVVLVMLFLLGLAVALLLVLVPMFGRQIALFLERLPGYLDWLKLHLAPWLQANLGIEWRFDSAYLRDLLAAHWQDVEQLAAKFLPSLKSVGTALIGFLANLMLVPVVLFYLLRDWEKIIAHIDELVPRRWHERVSTLTREIDSVLAAFLRGQISVMLLMSAFYSAGLWFAGLELALPVGILSGLLGFVPYLGLIVGLSLATLAAALQFQALGAVVMVWVVFGIGQLVEGMLLTPWMVGDRIGLHPVAVIFAVLAGGQLFGFFGVLLALPAAAALAVWLRQVRKLYLKSGLYHR